MYEQTNLTSAKIDHYNAIALADRLAPVLPLRDGSSRMKSLRSMMQRSHAQRIEMPSLSEGAGWQTPATAG